MSELLIYQAGNGNIQVKLSEKTVWLSLNQMAELFDRDKSVISRHLRNIFHDEELVREQVVAKMQQLPVTVKRIRWSITISMPLFLLVIESTLKRNSVQAVGYKSSE